MKKSVEPRWNQTFMYSPVHQREFKERLLELTVWDQARVREEESQFLGEVRNHLSALGIFALCCYHSYDEGTHSCVLRCVCRFWWNWTRRCWTISPTGTSCSSTTAPPCPCPVPPPICRGGYCSLKTR